MTSNDWVFSNDSKICIGAGDDKGKRLEDPKVKRG